MSDFNDDMIRRSDLPRDAFEVLHDLAYCYAGMADWKLENLVHSAQLCLRRKQTPRRLAAKGRSASASVTGRKGWGADGESKPEVTNSYEESRRAPGVV